MYLDTAASETSKPSILSSPWIRGAPHNGFSRDIRRISPRTSLDTGGRPGFPRRDFRVQKRRKPFRCQPITVSGLTITRISLQPDWPNSVILAKNAIDALSVLSLHLVPAGRKGCAVVSTGGATASLPEWIEAWNPGRIFCAYDATRQGDDAAARLIRNDSRVVRLRPALDGLDWNDMLMRDRASEPLQIDDRPLD